MCALRSPRTQAIQAFVRQSIGYLEHSPDKETKISLIKTLLTVTEGKVRPCHAPLRVARCVHVMHSSCKETKISLIKTLLTVTKGKVRHARHHHAPWKHAHHAFILHRNKELCHQDEVEVRLAQHAPLNYPGHLGPF